MYYKVCIKERIEIFQDVSGVYGFLIGIYPNYRKIHPNKRLFKRWIRAKKRAKGNKFEHQSKNHPFNLEILSHVPS